MGVLEAIAIIVGVVSGVSGSVLGILNHVHQRDITRPRIVVRPRVYNIYRTKTQEVVEKNAAVMEICNVGHLPVIGSTLGFLPRWQWLFAIAKFLPKRVSKSLGRFVHQREQGMGAIIPKPKPMDGLPWTGRELGPQQRAMLRFELDDLPTARRLGRAFASSVIGDTFKASRRDMRVFAEQRRASQI